MDWSLLFDQYFFLALFSFVLALILNFCACRIFPYLGLMDRPQKYGLTRAPIPYYGGLMIFLAFLTAVLLLVPIDFEVLGVLIAVTMIVLVGFFDDLLSVSPFLRLIVQSVAGFVLVACGVGIFSINLPFLGVLDFSEPVFFGVMVLSALFTVLWVATLTNVMNFLDGVSGLNSSVSFVAGLTLFALSVHPTLHENPASQQVVASLSLILAMVALAFLIFDFPQPKMLMGDTGSTFFGFMLATLAIFSGGKVATAFLVLGVPILDMIWVILRRLTTGQKIWQGDLKHLHHRLLDLGMSRQALVLLYLTISLLFGAAAVLLVSSNQKFFMLLALLLLMVLLAFALVLMPKRR